LKFKNEDELVYIGFDGRVIGLWLD